MFVVPVADLERGAKTVSWPIPDSWLASALEDVEAVPQGTEGMLEVELSKNGSEVLVRGRARVSVRVPCVVTLEPLDYELTPEIFLMLSKAPTPPPQPRSGRDGKRRAGAAAQKAGSGSKAGASAARAPRGRGRGGLEAWAQDPELTEIDAARDFFEGDKIVLDGFVREFILLELPMYPRRSDLPSEQTPARATPLPSGPPAADPVDPRLLPLAELRDRLRRDKKE